MNVSNIPLFIISYNRKSYIEKLVNWLKNRDVSNVIIVDNNSTYQPLLEYYKMCPYKVIHLKDNFGHTAVWTCGQFDSLLQKNYYIVTDCDILPTERCPSDIVEYLLEIINQYPDITKAGLSLKIDDIPDHYVFKDATLEWESQYYATKLSNNLYKAQIDTTFALYRPNTVLSRTLQWYNAARTAYPYEARHLPWYEDSLNPTEESLFYKKSRLNGLSNWDSHDLSELQCKNVKLRKEYNSLLEKHEKLQQEFNKIKSNNVDLTHALQKQKEVIKYFSSPSEKNI